MEKICKKHGLVEHSRRKDENSYRCRKCQVDSVQKRRLKVKQLALDYKGGECQHCGYSGCNGALEFHHIDESKKSFSIGNKGYTKSWLKIKEELDKCILLCANCHREEHERIRKSL